MIPHLGSTAPPRLRRLRRTDRAPQRPERPESVSRFSRARSVRISAARWYRSSRSFSSALLMTLPTPAAVQDSDAPGAAGAWFSIASKITAEVLPRKGRCASRHFVEHRAKREQVRPRVQFFASRLLRRHVSHRAQRRAGAGQVSRRIVVAVELPTPRPLRPPFGCLTLAKPKSRILACPRFVTKMFAGLMSR